MVQIVANLNTFSFDGATKSQLTTRGQHLVFDTSVGMQKTAAKANVFP